MVETHQSMLQKRIEMRKRVAEVLTPEQRAQAPGDDQGARAERAQAVPAIEPPGALGGEQLDPGRGPLAAAPDVDPDRAAVARPAPALSTPGPGTTAHVPTRPVARA